MSNYVLTFVFPPRSKETLLSKRIEDFRDKMDFTQATEKLELGQSNL